MREASRRVIRGSRRRGSALVAIALTLSVLVLGAGAGSTAVEQATLTLDGATVNASWQESWLIGNVTITGTVSGQSELSAFLRRLEPEPKVIAARVTFSAVAGGYTAVLKFPNRALPGTYLVRVTGTSGGEELKPVETTVTLPAPPEGIVDRSAVSLNPGGKSVRRVKASTRELFARFHFVVPPETRAVRILWRTPQFNFVGEVRKPYKPTVESFIKSGRPLAKGTWYVLLQVNEAVTKRIAVRVG
jgi:hypothetical protein